MRGWRAAALVAAGVAGAAGGARAEPEITEISGSVAVESRGFLHPPRFPGQRRHGASIALEPELYVEWADYTSLAIAPFLRLDSADSERSHGDIREFRLRIVRDEWELGAGVGKLFWGVTESAHIVDIVNQTDLIENIDLEDKLGQPMVDLTLVRDWGFVDLIWLPYFRERTFHGRRGRLRGGLVVAGDRATYEAGAGRWSPGFAVRYANSFGDWDIGAYLFHGTAREPTLALRADESGAPILAPHYEIVGQAGFDAQYTTGAWLWKLEALFREGQRDRRGAERDYAAFAGGFEYTLFGAFDTGADFGLLAEYLRDTRLNDAAGAFQDDLFLGGRLAFNDVNDTSVLAGAIQDLSGGARLFSLEAGRRVGDSFTLTVEARLFTDAEGDPALRDLGDDDFIQVVLGYHF